MKSARTELKTEDVQQDNLIEPQDLEQKPKELESKRGAKQLKDKKPKQAARVLFDKPVKTDRPISVYKERVTDADTGETGFFIWHHNEDSTTTGRQEIVRINPRTEEEFTVGYEYTIPYSKQVVADLIRKSFSKTKFYHKDGETRTAIKNPAEDF